MDGIRSIVRAILQNIAPEADLSGLNGDRPLREQIELDSIDWANVIAALGERLSVEIPESDYGMLASLDALVAYIASRQGGHGRECAPVNHRDAGEPARYTVNGISVEVRPMTPADTPLEAEFVRHLTADSRYDRFMVTMSELPKRKLKYLTNVDQVRHVALAATVEREGQRVLVGVARYVIDASRTGCEVAIALDDAWHRSGLAGILMQRLIDIARSGGLATMEGTVLTTNSAMRRFARQLGFTEHRDPESRDTVHIALSL